MGNAGSGSGNSRAGTAEIATLGTGIESAGGSVCELSALGGPDSVPRVGTDAGSFSTATGAAGFVASTTA
jgi:hypothetical protein